MTVNEIIEKVNDVKPNSYDDETKLRWLGELEGRILLVYLKREFEPFIFPADLERNMSLSQPWDSIYYWYLYSMIDFSNLEYSLYNNDIMMFNSLLDDYKKTLTRDNARTCNFKNIVP